MPEIAGRYSDGVSSKQVSTSLKWNDRSDIYLENIEIPYFTYDELRISSRVGNTARYIELPDGGVFETQNNDAVDLLIAQLTGSRHHNFLFSLENSKRFVFITLLIVVFSAWAFIQYGIPAMSRTIAMMIPQEQMQYLGVDVLSKMDGHVFQPSELDEGRQAALRVRFNEIIDAVTEATNEHAMHDFITVKFRKSDHLGANAFALPDGTVVFTDALINLSESEDEIISVLLHEIGHLYHRHSLRMAIQGFSLAAFVAVITGDVSTSSTIVTGLPVLLVESGYSRGMESEADTYSLQWMRQLNIAPENFAAILLKLERSHTPQYRSCIKSGKESSLCLEELALDQVEAEKLEVKENSRKGSVFDYFTSHPVTNERIERFK